MVCFDLLGAADPPAVLSEKEQEIMEIARLWE